MKNVFFMFVLIFVSVGIISSCSSDDEVAATATAEEEAAAAGTTIGLTDSAGTSSSTTWKSACSTWTGGGGSNDWKYVFSGATLSDLSNTYSDDNCTTQDEQSKWNYTIVPSTTASTITNEADNSSVTGYKAVLTVTGIYHVFNTQTGIDRANTDNSSGGCEKTDWVLNTTKETTGLACNSSDRTDKRPAVGKIFYTMWYVNGTNLMYNFGLADNLTSVASDNYTKQ